MNTTCQDTVTTRIEPASHAHPHFNYGTRSIVAGSRHAATNAAGNEPTTATAIVKMALASTMETPGTGSPLTINIIIPRTPPTTAPTIPGTADPTATIPISIRRDAPSARRRPNSRRREFVIRTIHSIIKTREPRRTTTAICRANVLSWPVKTPCSLTSLSDVETLTSWTSSMPLTSGAWSATISTSATRSVTMYINVSNSSGSSCDGIRRTVLFRSSSGL